MPKWIHDRAEHLLAKNPKMEKGTAFAIATQQGHALGKSPKGYGTREGRMEARAKYDTPKDDKKSSNPGGLTSPKLASSSSESFADYTSRQSKLVHKRFDRLKGMVRNEGAFAGTGHRRVLIPKTKLTEADINHLGFQPVSIAIPEAGQNQFRSFRHPNNNFHIHSHPEGWTMHEDEHAAATMIAKGRKTVGGKAKAMIEGAPHVGSEGLPGLYYYVKGQLTGAGSTAHRVADELPAHVKRRMARWADSPAAQRLEAKLAYPAGDSPYLLDGLHKSKTRRLLPPDAPNPAHKVKRAFSESMYSAGTGPGRPRYASYIPPFRVPTLKTSGPPSEELVRTAAMTDELAKLNAVQSPESQITKSQSVGAPKVTAPPGPSIAQVSKPIGFGTPMPGATKS